MTAITVFFAEYLIFAIAASAAIAFCFLSPEGRRDVTLFTAATLPLVFLAASIASLLYAHPQPFVDGAVPLVAHAIDNAFPSHHMLAAAAIASVIFLRLRLLGGALWALALLVGAARVLAGLHYPIDIVVSAAIAALVPFLVFLTLRRLSLL